MIVLLLSGSVDAVVKTVCGDFSKTEYFYLYVNYLYRVFISIDPRGVKSPLSEARGPSPYRSGFVIRERAKT